MKNLHRLATFAIALLLPAALHAQQVMQPAITGTATTATGTATLTTADVTTGTGAAAPNPKSEIQNPKSDDDSVIVMSPFNVDSSKDEGYTAMNTASGSRINTPLKDTAASISPFTQEFLNDVGAATVEDMLSYGGNIEGVGADDLQGGMNPDMSANTVDNNFRIRGMTMTTTMDGVEGVFNMDTYNIDRAEISSGPNSILFGMGQPGGMVNLTSRRANLQRNTFRVTNVLGTWFDPGKRWDYYRMNFDYNIVLVPRAMAFRLMGLYQDGNNNSWRYWVKSRDRRINPAISIKPFQNTQINISTEFGRTQTTPSISWNAADRVTAWLYASQFTNGAYPDRPIQQTFDGPALPGTGMINSGGANPYYVFVDNDQTLYDFRQSLQSQNPFAGTNSAQARLPADLSSYYYNVVGPGGLRDQQFNRVQIVVDQRIGDLNLQLGYYHTENHAYLHGLPGYEVALRGDPNKYISTPEWLGSSGASAVENPYVGQLYMEEQNWEYREAINRNDTLRLMAEYALNLKQYGRHRIIAFLEHSNIEVMNERKAEILVDENQHAISNTATPWAASSPNLLYRRHYVTEGDFSTYYGSTWEIPFEPFTMNGHTYHAQYVSRGRTHAKRTVDSATLSLQSYWFNDKLVTLFGGRFNDSFRKNEQASKITDENDPRILDGSKVWNESALNGKWTKGKHRRPMTYSAGGVWHINDRLSAFANYSSNRNDDSTDQNILGGTPEPSIGTTKDYGVMFDLVGNNSVFLRLTHFDTRQVNSLTVNNNNQMTDTSDRLQSIYDALYAATGVSPTDYPRPNTYNSGMSDVYSRGYEAELTARFSKSFTMRLTMSYTTRARENTFKEVFTYFNANIPRWMNLADPSKNGGKDIPYMDPTTGVPTTLYDYLLTQLYATGGSDSTGTGVGVSVRDDLTNLLLSQSGGMSSRPLKFNITARYTFQQGILKGTAIGGAVRYSDPNRYPDPYRLGLALQDVTREDHPTDLRLDSATFMDYSTMSKGNSLLFYDVFANYRMKVFGGRTTMTLQLNIRNLFNAGPVTAARYNLDTNSGVAFLRRVYINDPRSIRLTATFDF